MESEGIDVFDLLDFYFIIVGTKMVGEKIWYTPMSEPLGEDWNQFPLLPQGPMGIFLLPSQDIIFLEKWSVNSFPLFIQIEKK